MFVAFFAQSIEARFWVENEDAAGARLTDDAHNNYIWVINNFFAYYFHLY